MAGYATTNPRLSKDDLYLILAFWMESFPDDKPSEDRLFKKVGAVLVLPNDICYAIDWSRVGVHAVVRLIMTHPDKLKGSKVFVSRKPCSFCTKLLVQKEVQRVFNLPIEPEYFPIKQLSKDEDKSYESEKACVDNLFKVSPIAVTTFVPEVEDEVVNAIQNKYKSSEEDRWVEKKDELLKRYWNQEWISEVQKYLPWGPFDEMMKSEVNKRFENMMTWISTILVESDKRRFKQEHKGSANTEDIKFNPTTNENKHKQAYHFMILAKFLAERTDDPRTELGAAIIDKSMEIVGLGWNGFPRKARYGEFARASRKNEGEPDNKYPYDAEQNALMMRNTKIIDGGTLFMTKTPSDESTALFMMQGIKTVVLGEESIEEAEMKGINHEKFSDGVKNGKFICFCLKRQTGMNENSALTSCSTLLSAWEYFITLKVILVN